MHDIVEKNAVGAGLDRHASLDLEVIDPGGVVDQARQVARFEVLAVQGGRAVPVALDALEQMRFMPRNLNV